MATKHRTPAGINPPRLFLSQYPALLNYHATFFGGMARTLDVAGTLTPGLIFAHPAAADRGALEGDWGAIGIEMRDAMFVVGGAPKEEDNEE